MLPEKDKLSNEHKANWNKCHSVADKYIEFEPVIIIVDFMLLSPSSYRHALYNRDFKLFWKLSLMLLLLESLTLWRENTMEQFQGDVRRMPPHENGFYYSCAYKIGEFILCTLLMMIATFLIRPSFFSQVCCTREYCFQLLKANALANFSKIFLLPIILWRENTTDIGASLHRNFVLLHHLCALVSVYMVVSHVRLLKAALIVIPVYATKAYVMQQLVQY
ncbi:protein ARV1 isoform X2 [Stomoxys calcitrans]|uniref:protein ARV1 isoform X2 n=1 Tax=Stomoxys calcitrans TaxID=35570 RepID=UPI0027E24A88|nr:protein ARV1 isoform X2 [Stomoxys calcitrans]